jgi:peptidyl-tRNA hydrolase
VAVYEVVVARGAERTLRLSLDDLVDTWVSESSGRVTLEIVDQARLVAAIDRLHALGLVIEHVDHVADRTERRA